LPDASPEIGWESEAASATLSVAIRPTPTEALNRDGGHIADPLAGRHQLSEDDLSGRGLWIVNQLCDLVEL
jgi:hypothetical protein